MRRVLLITLYLFVPFTLLASEREEFGNLLNNNRQVKGVVFDIVGGDTACHWKSPTRIKGYQIILMDFPGNGSLLQSF